MHLQPATAINNRIIVMKSSFIKGSLNIIIVYPDVQFTVPFAFASNNNAIDRSVIENTCFISHPEVHICGHFFVYSPQLRRKTMLL